MTSPSDASIGAAKPIQGLTSDEARRLLETVGTNSTPDTAIHPLRRAAEKLWAPVPWMLETAIVLQLILHKFAEASVITGLLLFNAALAFFQEGKAQATLAALKSRLALNAWVQRDGEWRTIPASELVPGDLLKLSLGGVVAADVEIVSGSVLLDQSMLTGESVPVESGGGAQTYAGALVRRGEAIARVLQTGQRTKFGHTADLVRTAHVVSSQQKVVLTVVRNLAIFNGVVIGALIVLAKIKGMGVSELAPLSLTAILSAIPVALPATFTLASAIGARSLAGGGVLSTRLSAVAEAGSIDVLCSDKTGTLTRNELSVSSVRPINGFSEAEVLAFATLASADGGDDPVDAAIRTAAGQTPASRPATLIKFTPFDPAQRISAATASDAHGETIQVVKGAYAAVTSLAEPAPLAATAADELERHGYRVLAVATSPVQAKLRLIGLIALSDPPRPDSSVLVGELESLGVRTLMVTGDAPATAAIVANAVGLKGKIYSGGAFPAELQRKNMPCMRRFSPRVSTLW